MFSVPKSVSLLWAFAPRAIKKRIEAAQAAAVGHATELLFSECGFARAGPQGAQSLMRTNIVAARFLHIATRQAFHSNGKKFADPNLHTHVIVPDKCIADNSKCRTLYQSAYMTWSRALEAWHFAALAFELRQAGVPIEAQSNKKSTLSGLFQVSGFEKNWISEFSARAKQIKRRKQTLPSCIKFPIGSDALAKDTRNGFKRIVPRSCKKRWRNHATKIGLDISKIIEKIKKFDIKNIVLASDAEIQSTISECMKTVTMTESVVGKEAFYQAFAAAIVSANIQTLPSIHIIEAALLDVKNVEELIPTTTYQLRRFSTIANIEAEQQIIKIASSLVNEQSDSVVFDCITNSNMNYQQEDAVAIACSNSRLVLVEGAPGTGKTRLVEPVIAAHRAAGFRVLGATQAWRAIIDMKRDLMEGYSGRGHELFEVFSISQLLKQIFSRKLLLDEKTLLIIDEVGLVCTMDMKCILEAVSNTKCKILLLGDENQMKPIGAGSGLNLIKRAQPNGTKLTLIVRQRNPKLRSAVQALVQAQELSPDSAEEELLEQIDIFVAHMMEMGNIRTPATVETAVSNIANLIVDGSENSSIPNNWPIAFARTNEEINFIAKIVRKIKRERGQLQKDEIDLRAQTPSDSSFQLSLSVGDRIRFCDHISNLNVINGTQASIVGITGFGGADLAHLQFVATGLH